MSARGMLPVAWAGVRRRWPVTTSQTVTHEHASCVECGPLSTVDGFDHAEDTGHTVTKQITTTWVYRPDGGAS